jgi:hypothetical protein
LPLCRNQYRVLQSVLQVCHRLTAAASAPFPGFNTKDLCSHSASRLTRAETWSGSSELLFSQATVVVIVVAVDFAKGATKTHKDTDNCHVVV